MSWLSDQEHVCVYVCEHCGSENYWKGAWDGKPDHLVCNAPTEHDMPCGDRATYKRFEPIQLGGAQKVAFDQNGVQAYAIKGPNGTTTYMSKAKYHYLESNGQIKEYYTKEYNHKKQSDQETAQRKAKVSVAKAVEYANSVKKMRKGEV